MILLALECILSAEEQAALESLEEGNAIPQALQPVGTTAGRLVRAAVK